MGFIEAFDLLCLRILRYMTKETLTQKVGMGENNSSLEEGFMQRHASTIKNSPLKNMYGIVKTTMLLATLYFAKPANANLNSSPIQDGSLSCKYDADNDNKRDHLSASSDGFITYIGSKGGEVSTYLGSHIKDFKECSEVYFSSGDCQPFINVWTLPTEQVPLGTHKVYYLEVDAPDGPEDKGKISISD